VVEREKHSHDQEVTAEVVGEPVVGWREVLSDAILGPMNSRGPTREDHPRRRVLVGRGVGLRALAAVLLLSTTAVADETYPILIHRPETVGSRHRIEANGLYRLELEKGAYEAHVRPLVVAYTVQATAASEVLAVGPAGEAVKVRFTIGRLNRVDEVRTTRVLEEGVAVVAELADGKVRYTIDGKSPGDEASEVLSLALDGRFDAAKEERAYAPGVPKRPGDTWAVHAEAVAFDLRRSGLAVPPQDIRGQVKFREIAEVKGVRCLVLAADSTAALPVPPLPDGVEVKTSEVSSTCVITVPVDSSQLLSHRRCSMRQEVDASDGKTIVFHRTEVRTREMSAVPDSPPAPGRASEPIPSGVVGVWVGPVQGGQGRIAFREDGSYTREWPEGGTRKRFSGTYEVKGEALLVEDAEEPGTLLKVPFRRTGNDGLELTIEGDVVRLSREAPAVRKAPAPAVLPPYESDAKERAALTETEAYLRGGGPVDARDSDGWTRLHYAAARGQAEVATRLLEARADPNAATADGATPLHLAGGAGRLHVVSRLLDAGADPARAQPDGVTPLSRAIVGRHADVATLLIQRGAPLEARGPLGFTPLLQAVHGGLVEVARALLDRGASIDGRAEDGRTALHIALLGRQSELVQLLLERGADPRVRDKDGETPLHVAAGSNLVPFLARLLEAGAELEARAENGFTALHQAAWADKREALDFLLERGADPTAQSKLGTPEDVARRQGHLDLAHHLMDVVRARRPK